MKNLLLVCALIITPALYAQEAEVVFHNFHWGTSMAEFTAKMGKPAHTDEVNGLQSLVYDNLIVSGYQAFMVAFFSKNGLEGGTYYFNTFSREELMQCYTNVQKELLEQYGPTALCHPIFKEGFPYESSWNHLESGYIHLKVDTRRNDPVSLWFSSPALTTQLGIERRLSGS